MTLYNWVQILWQIWYKIVEIGTGLVDFLFSEVGGVPVWSLGLGALLLYWVVRIFI